MIPEKYKNDAYYNNLKWETVDGQQLDNIIEGCTVLGTEPTDYPLTDAITLYLQDKKGAVFALNIGADIFNTAVEDNPFYIELSQEREG